MKKILDIEGTYQQVTDLEEAIAQTKQFSGYQITTPGYETTNQRNFIYWTDLWIKLELVKAGICPSSISMPLRFPDHAKELVLNCLKENASLENVSEEAILIYREPKVIAGHLIPASKGKWQLQWE